MKDFIKQKLRESMNKNSLGVDVTRNNQELIVMRGISGSGKSTKAKTLLGKGVIHSTDDVIEAFGDYREFFAKMVADQVAKKPDAFAPLHKMHAKNLDNAKASMKAGVTPVIIDNTNIKQSEPKAYVVAALELGFADDNIKFVDIGAAGMDAEALAARNKHGVPIEKIKAMIDSHTGQGPLTLKSVLASENMFKSATKKILFSAVVLDEKSRNKLIETVSDMIPEGWEVIAHHMTIIFGKGLPDNLKHMLGKAVTLIATKVGKNNMALSVMVDDLGLNQTGKTPHITIAINKAEGAKPVMGGSVVEWEHLTPFGLTGVVTEVTP